MPLSAHGQAQAKAAAARVVALGAPVAAVVSSPLSRCTATAEAVCAVAGGQVCLEPGFIECDFGEWEACTFAEVRQRWPGEFREWMGSPAVAPPGGESLRQVADRVLPAAERVRSAYPGQVVVVVSHVSPIKLVLRDALAAGDELMHRLHLDPAGISIVDSWADGAVSVRTVNDISHLPPR